MPKAPRAGLPSEIRSLLVYSSAEITGDGIIKLPFLAATREAFPAAHLTWCAADGHSVFGGWLEPVAGPLMNELLLGGPTGADWRECLPTARPFGGRRFDLILDTQQNLRCSLALRAATPCLISASLRFALSARRPVYWPDDMAGRLRTLLSLAAEREVSFRPLQLSDPELESIARKLLAGGRGPLIGLAPGAGGRDRRWPLARYLELAEALIARGCTPVFLLGPQEEEYSRVIAARCASSLMPLQMPHGLSAERAPLLSFALAARFDAAVANDAGPAHILAAGGSPLVCLFRTHHKATKFRPAAERLECLVAEDSGWTSMESIQVPAVLAALERLLPALRQSVPVAA